MFIYTYLYLDIYISQYVYDRDNLQLAVLPQYGDRELDPRRVHDNLSVPL